MGEDAESSRDENRKRLKLALREKRNKRITGVPASSQQQMRERAVMERCGENATMLRMANSLLSGKGLAAVAEEEMTKAAPKAKQRPKCTEEDDEEEEEAPPPSV